MKKLYRISINGVRSLSQDFLLEYCKNNDAGIFIDVSDEVGILYTQSSIQVYKGRDKVKKIREQKMEEMDVKELLK